VWRKRKRKQGIKIWGGGQRIEMWCGSCVEGQSGVKMALGFMPYQDMVVESAFFFFSNFSNFILILSLSRLTYPNVVRSWYPGARLGKTN
jgi:hypothetical protein